jgi:hypothetical protein
MISRPSRGQLVQCWYRAALRGVATHHGRCGVILAPAKGPGPRNHAVLFPDGTMTFVPSGNLRPPKLPRDPQFRLFP